MIFLGFYLSVFIIINFLIHEMENNRFEPPKMAIIRLLRSQGCC